MDGVNATPLTSSLGARCEFDTRHHWEEGDLVIWDELATHHAGPVRFTPERELVRIYGGLTRPAAAREFA